MAVVITADDVTINGTSVSDGAIPAGTIAYFGASTVPAGFLKADGSAISRTTYANLFTAIGTTFGTGDGSTTFNLPDLRGEFIRGFDDGKGTDSGRALGSAQAEDVAAHDHGIYNRGDKAFDSTGGGNFIGKDGSADSGTSTLRYTELSTGTETRPRNIAMLACIKY